MQTLEGDEFGPTVPAGVEDQGKVRGVQNDNASLAPITIMRYLFPTLSVGNFATEQSTTLTSTSVLMYSVRNT